MKIETSSLDYLLSKCTKEERKSIGRHVMALLERIEEREKEKIALLISRPHLLDGLSAFELVEVADVGIADAHTWILNSCPQAETMLLSLECLLSFNGSSEAPTMASLKDVVNSLKVIWAATRAEQADKAGEG